MELINIHEDIKWSSIPENVVFNKNANHIFRINVKVYFHRIRNIYGSHLSQNEVEKAFRFVQKTDSERYIVAKYTLRKILSAFLLVPAVEISFHKAENKKPYVNGIEFNVTHSKNYILIGVSSSKIGIDIEHIDHDFTYDLIASSNFSPEELKLLNQDNSSLNFYSIWTRKEAILKASGEGLTDDMTELNSLSSIITRKQAKYRLRSFKIDKEYTGCIAFEERTPNLNYWDYQ